MMKIHLPGERDVTCHSAILPSMVSATRIRTIKAQKQKTAKALLASENPKRKMPQYQVAASSSESIAHVLTTPIANANSDEDQPALESNINTRPQYNATCASTNMNFETTISVAETGRV